MKRADHQHPRRLPFRLGRGSCRSSSAGRPIISSTSISPFTIRATIRPSKSPIPTICVRLNHGRSHRQCRLPQRRGGADRRERPRRSLPTTGRIPLHWLCPAKMILIGEMYSGPIASARGPWGRRRRSATPAGASTTQGRPVRLDQAERIELRRRKPTGGCSMGGPPGR